MQCLVSPEAEFREIPVFDNGAKITLAARAKRADGCDAGCEHRRGTEAGEAGFGPIHGVVNNAGVTATMPALEQDDWFICAAYRWDEDKREPRQLIPCRNGSLERSLNS
jgi:NAD(P)-dependent dehydrogenase (short-subunit alcohol dehydrogenase family)